MNQRKLRSRLTCPVTCLVHVFLLGIFWLWMTGLVSVVQADQAQTNNLGDLSLESLMQLEVPVVSGASKFAQKSTEAPAYVTVVTKDEIQRYGYRTLADLLQGESGFNISYDRNYAYLGDRGINLGDFNSRTLLLVDGHRVNNNLTDGAYVDTAFILDLDLVDRVEIIRGPSAVLYGNNAFFGVINVATRKASQIDGLEVSGGYGSFDTYKGRMTYGKAFTNGVELLLSGSIYDSAGASKLFYGTYNQPENNHGIAQDLDSDAAGSSFGSLKYHDFTLEGAFDRRVKDNPSAQYFTTFNVPGLQTEDNRGYVDLKYAREFAKDLDLTAKVYYDYAEHSIGYPYNADEKHTLFKETQTGQWWGTELQLSKRLWEKHTIMLGAEYRDDFLQEDLLIDSTTGKIFTDNHATRQSYGIYAEADVELLKQLRLNGGVRYDQYGDFDPAIDPRVALIYEPFKESTFKAIYGTAFRAPNFLELSDPRFQNITPETIKSYELVYEQGIGKNLRSSVSGFYNQMDDLIVIQNGRYGNITAESKGLELALTGTWANGLIGRVSYTLQNVDNLSGSQNLPDSPEQLVKFNISVPVIKQKLFASLEFQYASSRAAFYTASTGQTMPGLDVAPYNVVNFTLFSQNLIKNLDISATVYNLLDEHYSDPATPYHLQGDIPQSGRTFGVKLTYRF